MSVSISAPISGAVREHAGRPTFVGTLKGELLKMSRQRSIWVMSVLLFGLLCAPYVLFMLRPGWRDEAKTDPLTLIYSATQIGLSVARIFGGFYLVILAALVIGLEYQHGTIRILLARGVGKLQLLGAKVLALALVAAGIMVVDMLVQLVLTPAYLAIASGSLSGLSTLDGTFWSDTWLYLLTVLISMGVTLLLGVAATVVGRSLAFGLGVGLSWFAADNIGVEVMLILAAATHNTFWANVTAYFLGPLLNFLPVLMVPNRTGRPAMVIGAQPLVSVTELHALLVILAYAVIFAVVAVVLTWRRDVLE